MAEQTVDPIAVARNLSHIPSILTRTISGTEPKILSVTYMLAGENGVRNIIPQECEFAVPCELPKKKYLKKWDRNWKKK